MSALWECEVKTHSCDTSDNKTTIKFTVKKLKTDFDISYVALLVKSSDVLVRNKDTQINDILMTKNDLLSCKAILDDDLNLSGSSMMNDQAYTSEYYILNNDKITPYLIKWEENLSAVYSITFFGMGEIRKKYWVVVKIDNRYNITELIFTSDQITDSLSCMNNTFEVHKKSQIMFNCDYTMTIECNLNSLIQNRHVMINGDFSQFKLVPNIIAELLSTNVHKLEYTKNCDKIVIDDAANADDSNPRTESSNLILTCTKMNENHKINIGKYSVFDRLIRVYLDKTIGSFGTVIKNHYTMQEPDYYFVTQAIVESLYEKRDHIMTGDSNSRYTDSCHKKMTECIENVTSPDRLMKFANSWLMNLSKSLDSTQLLEFMENGTEIDFTDAAFVYYFKYKLMVKDKLDVVTICVIFQNLKE